MDVKKISNNTPRVGLYALLKSRSQQQQANNINSNHNNNHSIQQTNKLEKVPQKESMKPPNHPSPVQTKKPPPPLVKPKPKRPINFIRTNSKSETFFRNLSEDKGELINKKSSGCVNFANDKNISNDNQNIDDSAASIKPSQLFKASDAKS